jgi:hypothetical protein
MAESYLYAVDSKFIPILTLFGLRSKTQGVTVDEDGAFSTTFGWFHHSTPLISSRPNNAIARMKASPTRHLHEWDTPLLTLLLNAGRLEGPETQRLCLLPTARAVRAEEQWPGLIPTEGTQAYWVTLVVPDAL